MITITKATYPEIYRAAVYAAGAADCEIVSWTVDALPSEAEDAEQALKDLFEDDIDEWEDFVYTSSDDFVPLFASLVLDDGLYEADYILDELVAYR